MIGAPGLRGRFVAALVLTSTLTLAVAGAALLPPLKQRLEREQLRSLTDATMGLRAGLAALPAGELERGSPALRRITRRLGRRLGARVTVLDSGGHTLTGRGGHGSSVARAVAARRTLSIAHHAGGALQLEVVVPATVGGRPGTILATRSSADAALATHVVRRAFLLAALIGLAISALVGVAISGRLLRRLRALRRTALTVSEQGADAVVPADRGRDEVGDLSRALATMQRELRRQEDARRTFVATASHELRTPLALLSLTLELLDDRLDHGELRPSELKGEIRRARAQALRLSGLASALLDLSRIDAGLPLRSEPVDVVEVCRAVAAEFEPRLNGGRSVDLQLPARCWARADPTAVARILAILLDNAVRYTPPREVVRVAVANGGPTTTVSVADAGPGVPAADRERIFERFERGSSAAAGDGGFGLGLAIGADLAARMQGRLMLADAPAGANFQLRLPAEPHP